MEIWENCKIRNIFEVKVCVNRELNLRIHLVIQKSIGHKLQKASAVEDSSGDSSDNEDSSEEKEPPEPPEEPKPEKTWEELQVEYLQEQLQQYHSLSEESVKVEPEKALEIDLSNLYQENPPSEKSPLLEKKLSQDTLDVIDDLIKSFEETIEANDGETIELKENETVELKENETVDSNENDTVDEKNDETVEEKNDEIIEVNENESVREKENEIIEVQEMKIIEEKEDSNSLTKTLD